MSLMKTLARVAAGVMLAKGIGAMMKNSSGSGKQTGGGVLGDLFGGQQGQTRSGSGSSSGSAGGAGGGLGGMLGQVLGGGNAGRGTPYGGSASRGAQGGLGGILDSLGGQSSRSGSSSSGGLGGILGGAAAGGLGGILGDLLGSNIPQQGQQQSSRGSLAQRDSQPANDASFGELFNDALSNQDEPQVAPTPEQNAIAGLMLKAMIQAAKSDGKIDEAEKQRLMGEFGELDEAERSFIREQMAAPLDPVALAREVPQGLGPQVYTMSLMAIDFDSKAEAEYLHALATALGMDQAQVNDIHAQVGVQTLYT